MKWLKKWAYLIVFMGVGFAYLTCVDEWQVYAKPLSQLNKWIAEQAGESAADEQEHDAGELAEGNAGNAGGAALDNVADGAADDNAGDTTDGAEDDKSGDAVAGSAGETAESAGQGSLGNADGTGSGSAGNVDGAGQGNAGELAGEIAQGTGQDSTGGTTEGNVHGTMDEVVDDSTELNGDQTVDGDEFVGDTEPVYMTVEDDYFADAVFIGDSRTVGMFEYGGLEEITTFYASTGLSVYDISKEQFIKLPGRKKKATVIEALEENSFAKVYLMLGINEMGTGTAETFAAKYAEVITQIQELQPDAIIYIQSIMKVSEKRSGQGDYIHNEGITARNEAIAQLADNEQIFYLDVNPLICDETGGMVADYTTDGVHLKAKYIGIWKQFLKEHAILKLE